MNERWLQRVNLKPIKPQVHLLLQKSFNFNDESLSKQRDPLEGNSTSCSCSMCPEVVHSSPTCSVHNSVDFPEPRVCQAGWALAGASSASSLLRCTHITNFQKQAEQLGGATQPHSKATESWLFGERPWIFCGWSVHLREAISLKGSLAKNISEKHHTWKPLNKNSYFIF